MTAFAFPLSMFKGVTLMPTQSSLLQASCKKKH